MSTPLNKSSKMECSRHGKKAPAFICKHLQYGDNVGFFEPDEAPDAEWPFKNAWCSDCEIFAIEKGGWNDSAEEFAKIIPICEGCYDEIKQRNT